jgi:hypothetical protein
MGVDLVLDVAEDKRKKGAKALAFPPHGRENQGFLFDHVGRLIPASQPSLCLDVSGGGTSVGTPLIFWSIKSDGLFSGNQRFTFDESGDGLLIPAHAPSLAVGIAPQLLAALQNLEISGGAESIESRSSSSSGFGSAAAGGLVRVSSSSNDRGTAGGGLNGGNQRRGVSDSSSKKSGSWLESGGLPDGGLPLELVHRSSSCALRWHFKAPPPRTEPSATATNTTTTTAACHAPPSSRPGLIRKMSSSTARMAAALLLPSVVGPSNNNNNNANRPVASPAER